MHDIRDDEGPDVVTVRDAASVWGGREEEYNIVGNIVHHGLLDVVPLPSCPLVLDEVPPVAPAPQSFPSDVRTTSKVCSPAPLSFTFTDESSTQRGHSPKIIHPVTIIPPFPSVMLVLAVLEEALVEIPRPAALVLLHCDTNSTAQNTMRKTRPTL